MADPKSKTLTDKLTESTIAVLKHDQGSRVKFYIMNSEFYYRIGDHKSYNYLRKKSMSEYDGLKRGEIKEELDKFLADHPRRKATKP